MSCIVNPNFSQNPNLTGSGSLSFEMLYLNGCFEYCTVFGDISGLRYLKNIFDMSLIFSVFSYISKVTGQKKQSEKLETLVTLSPTPLTT